jgi:uncharacterized Zn finger protein (UPF0148 family)
MKACVKCGQEAYTKEGDNTCSSCKKAATPAQKEKRKRDKQAREDIMRSLGLVKVRGAMGGTYWE